MTPPYPVHTTTADTQRAKSVRREAASFKGAVPHRKNALFYRTLNGAQVGDSPADHRSFAAP
jgi:hypothetical protein